MFKRAVVSLILIITLSTTAVALEPGVFLPLAFLLYGNVESEGVLGDIDGHKVVAYESTPQVMGCSTDISSQSYTLNLGEAAYYGLINLQIGNTYYTGIPTGADGYGHDAVTFVVNTMGFAQQDFHMVLGGGAGLMPPAGTVPLIIERQGDDVKLTWDTVTYTNPIDIYLMTGDGTGQFHNEYPGSPGWAMLVTSATGGEHIHSGQIGGGDMEVYYKAIENGEDPNTKMPVAWAVGKIDVQLINNSSSDYNFMSMPLVALNGNNLSENFAEQLDLDGVEIYDFDEQTGDLPKAWYDSYWQYTSPAPFNIEMGMSYWVRMPSDKRVSLLGAVRTTEFTKTMLDNRYLTLSSPFPINRAFDDVLPANSDLELYLYDNETKDLPKMFDGGGSWENSIPLDPVFNLIPGAGYWFRNMGSEFDWTVSP